MKKWCIFGNIIDWYHLQRLKNSIYDDSFWPVEEKNRFLENDSLLS